MNRAVGLATYILKKTTSHFYRVLVLFFSDKSILRLSLFERKMRPLVKWFWQMLCYWPKTSSNDWGYGAIRLKEKGRKRAAVVLHLVFAFWYGQNGKSRMRWLNALSCEGFVDSVHIWESVLIYHKIFEPTHYHCGACCLRFTWERELEHKWSYVFVLTLERKFVLFVSAWA